MTIIQEMRRIAERCENQGMVTIAVDARDLADRLECSGAMVPVPDGGVCRICDASDTYIMVNGNVYFPEERGDWCGLAENASYLHGDIGDYDEDELIVQRVRLVPIAEAGI